MNGTGRRISNENDRRVKRTKRSLRDALLKLLEEKTFNQISVTELTELADVNRATFYFYYDDVCDMILKLQEEVYVDFETLILHSDPLDTVEELDQYFEDIIDFCAQNAEMCKFMLNSDVASVHYRKIVKLLCRNTPNSTKRFPLDDPKHYLTIFAIYAMMGVVAAWLNDDMKLSKKELSQTMVKLYLEGANSVR